MRAWSLEPSLVVVSWYLLLCKTCLKSYSFAEVAFLANATWIGYSLDRFWEMPYSQSRLSVRHKTLKKNCQVFKFIWLLLIFANAVITFFFLNPLNTFLISFLLVCALLSIYISVNETFLGLNLFFSKDIRTPILLSSLTSIFLISKVNDILTFITLFLLLYFLYSVNIILFSFYERKKDASENRTTIYQSKNILIKSFIICIISLIMINIALVSKMKVLTIPIALSLLLLFVGMLIYKNTRGKSHDDFDTLFWVVPLSIFLFS